MESTSHKCRLSVNTSGFGTPTVSLDRLTNEYDTNLVIMDKIDIFFLFGSVASLLSYFSSGTAVTLSVSLSITLGPLVVLLVVGVLVWKIFDVIE